MKLSKKSLQTLLPLSYPTIARIALSDPKFPTCEKIGREKFYHVDGVLKFLAGRASQKIKLSRTDKIITAEAVCKKLNRSKPWLWENLVKTQAVTRFNLSPEQSEFARNYFLEREIVEKFPELIELAEQGVAQ